MSELDGITVKVKAEVDEALLKLRAVRDAIKEIRSKTATIRVKEEFKETTKVVAATTKEVKKLGSEIGNTSRDSNRLTSGFKTLFRDVNKGVKDINGGFLRNIGGGVGGFFKNLSRGAKDTWKSVKDVGKALDGVVNTLWGFGKEGVTVGKSFSQLGTSMLGVVTSAAAMGPALIVLAGLLAAILLPLGAMLSGLLAAAGALAAGALGIGALALVAVPAIKSLTTGLQGMSTATKNYSEASKNLNIGLANSKTAMAQYHAVLKATDPNLRSAVKLLRDQNLQWMHLSAGQRRSVVALSENKAALKAMSPAMKTALTALLAQKSAYDKLTPSQRTFAKSLSGVSKEWRALQRAAQPIISLLLNDLAKLAKDVLPLLTPVINATGLAIHRLLVRADNFVKSEKFKAWVHKLTLEIPGVITQVGNFISKLGGLIGPLMTNKKNVKDLHDVLQTVYNIMKYTVVAIGWLDTAWHAAASSIHPFVIAIQAVNTALNTTLGFLGSVASAINSLPSPGAILGGIGGLLSGHETGTPGAPPGWAWTGERGPELQKFTGGETVIPHGPSMAMARGYANGTPGWAAGGGPMNVNVYLDGKQIHGAIKKTNYDYNAANGNRARGGGPSGAWTPRG